jgi:signal transduction histidine kinase
VANGLLSTLLAEPAVPDPPRRVGRDWLLVGLFIPAVVVEGIVRDEVLWRPAVTVLIAAAILTLLWRRTHPLAMIIVAFSAVIGIDTLSRAFGNPPIEFGSSAFVLILPYALFRWASGRHAAIGLGVMLAALVSSLITDWTGMGDAIGGSLVLLFPAVLGAEVRHLVGSRERDREEVKMREREMLARELHDTVAHHVSAIAIRAQAGQVVGANDSAAALDALAVIEHEASRTLAEMRGIVGTLRGAEDPAFAPQPGLVDLQRLVAHGPAPRVDVLIDEGVGDVGPIVGAALYRVAQEAITNARRHARGATAITVHVTTDRDAVSLVVDDDGHSDPAARSSSGFGLVGMAERAHLLGGTLDAGPKSASGWRVTATIPRSGVAT